VDLRTLGHLESDDLSRMTAVLPRRPLLAVVTDAQRARFGLAPDVFPAWSDPKRLMNELENRCEARAGYRS
jgi:hypothetical protein